MLAHIRPPERIFKEQPTWSDHLRPVVGRAVYCEMSLATGIWAPSALEGHLRRIGDGEYPRNGTLRALRRGGNSTWGTLVNLQNTLPEAGVLYWAYHPIFLLLDTDHTGPRFGAVVTFAVDTIWSQLREQFWPSFQTRPEPGSANPELEVLYKRDVLERLLETERCSTYDLSPMDALVLHMAMYFQAKRMNESRLASRAAGATHSLFIPAVQSHPHLLVNWVGLSRAMGEQIWGVEGVMHGVGPVLTCLGDHRAKHVRKLFPGELVTLAEECELQELLKTGDLEALG